MLAASVARMQRPMLVAVLSRWKHSWGEAEKRAGRLSGMSQVASPDLDAEPKPILHTDPFAGSTWALTVPYPPTPCLPLTPSLKGTGVRILGVRVLTFFY